MLSKQTYYCLSVLGMLILWGVLTQETNFALADIVPDNTLPIPSQTDTQNNITTISGGTQAGTNLFHSFKDFSIPTGSEALFNNAVDIQNILTRITGNSVSNIDGLLKANGTANLFLINPNGIVFGSNAQLEIGGSFFATSADSMRFADDSTFSTKNPDTKPLLTVNLPMGLQYGNAGDIQVQGSNLQVNSGKTLALVGGNVITDKGQLIAQSGRIELGGLKQEGTITLNTEGSGNGFSLDYPGGIQRGDLSITSTVARVSGDGGGSISVNARNLNLAKVGVLVGGFEEGLGGVDAVAGDINVNATDNITLSEGSVIATVVNSEATGNAGNINVQAGSLNLLSGSQLFSSTAGRGNAGNINVNVRDQVVFDSAGNAASTSGIISSVDTTGVGNGGNVTLDALSLTVNNGAQLNLLTNGNGNAGKLTVNAHDTFIIDGSNVGASGILTSVGETGIGQGGDIDITTGSLLVTNGAQLNALSKNQGSAGNVNINARDRVLLSGENRDNGAASAVFTTIDATGEGRGGKISILTDSLSITKGAGLYTLTNGKGSAGDIFIEAARDILIDGVNSQGGVSGMYTSVTPTAVGNAGQINISTGSLAITNGAALNTLTKGEGSAGNVFIKARDTISFDGINENGGASGIFTTVDENAVGNGGDINIETRSLSVTGGAGLFTLTKSQGNGGNVNINSDTVSFDGTNQNSGSSGIFSSVDRTENSVGIGQGGNITINTNSFALSRGAGLFALTRGEGDAGNITINAREQTFLDGVNSLTGGASGIYSTVEPQAVGDGKEVRIITKKLSVTNGATLSSTSAGSGAAGNITIDANSMGLNNGTLSADTVEEEGNINLRGTDLILRNGSNITTNATGENVIGGNINIDNDVLAVLENSRISANSIDFRGGRVTINTQEIFGTQPWYPEAFRGYITATGATPDLSGTVQINTPDLDPNNGLIELPVNLVDASNQISNACTPGSREFENTFVSTGRGGLPMNPTEPLQGSSTLSEWVKLKPQSETVNTRIKLQPAASTSSHNQIKKSSPIVEATGWIVDGDGNIEFVAQANQTNSKSPWQTPASCSVPQ
ncbi:S-layer family protein [Rivularia sp. UHCC 0363]|uniref:S-layer family protein n=1 Tax=Rivularia sp. UHCC 0363 TaxID=3110244 RepID=UPI002B2190C5|nr:S-layer family protein [Rivularia sp. UHCC 0363]MEA5598405.1 S-layer family protein [Rivularia sp. UHCC 0363]